MGTTLERLVSVEDIDDVTVVTFLTDEILEKILVDQLGEILLEIAAQEEREKILLDFTGVEFLASTFLGKLIRLGKKTARLGQHLRLCSMKPEIYQVFAITKLNKLFHFDRDRAAALLEFAGPIPPPNSSWLEL